MGFRLEKDLTLIQDHLRKTSLLSHERIRNEIPLIRVYYFWEGLDTRFVMATPVLEDHGSVDNLDLYTYFLGQFKMLFFSLK